jgi:ABC-type transport system substrate-binding protein
MDVNLRSKKYERFMEYFNDDVPAIGLFQSNLTYFVNKNVRAFSQENHFVTAADRLLDVERWGIEKTSKNRTP